MKSDDIRRSFLEFFEGKGHVIVPSASLMPTAPNLLFTNAGMNPFVPYFLGEREAADTRVADTQKCIRAGGKHNDLDDVGFDTYHHTFFEMLGNWSFGDYFKEEAITWAWELLTGVWGLPKERLYATVYAPGEGDPASFDQEAYDLWKAIFEREGLDPDVHIVNGDKKDNFWMMGDTGPCGPCSEIHMDLTPAGDTGGSLVNADSGRCIELWNLVFIQFNATPEGDYVPLKAKHVDTGMGFERVAGIAAATKNFTDFAPIPSNYDSDLFGDLFAVLSEMSGHTYGRTLPDDRNTMSGAEMKDCAFRVLADHARTLCCSIADGILPGNEGRNYVLRRILRRAVLFAQRLNLPAGSFSKLVDPVVKKLGPIFPELEKQRSVIAKVIATEEATFESTLDRGLQLLDRLTVGEPGTIAGKSVFELYDTYGFPVDLTELIAAQRGWKIDSAAFEAEMEIAKQRSRDAQKKAVISVADGDGSTATEFDGYAPDNLIHFPAELLDVVESDGGTYLVFDRTPFYAEMGGQVGDTGSASFEGKIVFIDDTIKDGSGRFLHLTKATEAKTLIGKRAELTVDLDRRRAIQRNHSATHILNFALREVLGNHIRQEGSLVGPSRLRFDFAHFEPVTPEQIVEIEHICNSHILDNDSVAWYEIPYAEKPEEIVAAFGEKYGNIVRVVDIGGWSKELCGGTHVSATGEIGMVKIVAESGIAAGKRRIEAVVGEAAEALMEANFRTIQTLSNRMSCKPEELDQRLATLLDQKTSLERELKDLRRKESAAAAGDLSKSAREINGLKIVASTVEADNPNAMRGMAVQISKEIGEGVVMLGGIFGSKVTVLTLCTAKAVEAGLKAGDIVRELTGELGGKGGGKPDFAMGGATDTEKLEPTLDAYVDKVAGQLR